MDSKQRKLPKSRKAMEYRVYWLERKLKHLKVSEHRQSNRTQIAAMPDSPVKDLMHLTNEFHQANEQAAGLKTLTEELNKDALTLNERSERLHEVAAEKLATIDRTNRQSRRIQERGRKINKESLKTAAIARSINKHSQDNIDEMQRRIDEASYLSDLTRAQHEATDELNRTTRNLNEEAVKTTANSLKINRHLADTTEAARLLNDQAADMQAELTALKAALEEQDRSTIALNQTSESRLEEMKSVQHQCETIAAEAEQYVIDGREQINTSIALNEEVQETADYCAKTTRECMEQQQSFQVEAKSTKSELESLSEQLAEQVDEALAHNRSSLEEQQQLQRLELLSEQKSDFEALSDYVGDQFSKQTLSIQSELNHSGEQLEQFLSSAQQRLNDRDEVSAGWLSEKIQEFNQQARLRFLAVEERSKRLSTDLIERGETQLKQFEQASTERLEEVDSLVTTMTRDVQDNLVKSANCRTEAEALLESTAGVNTQTTELNNQTRDLINRSQIAVSKVDHALEEVTNVSRKMFRETRELQDRTESINGIAQKSADELNELNERSVQIQSESIQTQALSQEINRHSLDLNEQTRQLQGEFEAVRDSNLQTVHELQDLRQELLELGAKSQQQLQETASSMRSARQTQSDFEHFKEKTEALNKDLVETLSRASTVIQEVQSQSVESDALFHRSEDLTANLEKLKSELELQSQNALRASELANRTVDDLKLVEAEMLTTAQDTQAMNRSARASIESMEATQLQTVSLNEETLEVHSEMRQVISDARQINDDFMRGLESLSKKAELTDDHSQQLLAETEQLQGEIHNILDLKHGIDGFQRSVDAGQAQLASLIAKVDQCQEQSSSHELIVGQYKERMESYQADVTRYRESMLQLEKRFRSIDEQFHAQDIKLEENEHELMSGIQAQKAHLDSLAIDMQQKIATQQSELDRTQQEIREESEQIIDRVAAELRSDIDHKLDVAQRSTSTLMNQTEGEIRLLNSEMQQLNRSLQEEITTLKTETSVVNEQHALIQQEQIQQLSEQRSRSQQQDFAIDTLKQQLENYQRLIESHLDNAPHEQLQQCIKQLENSLRQQQRTLKQQEIDSEKPRTDARVTELQKSVEELNRSMSDMVNTNRDLKQCLDETRVNNQSLQKTNRELELNLSASQGELDHCLQRIHRLEAREASIDEALNTIKHRDTDTQQTLQQMRNAVKDSTKTMRETQRTLENLNAVPDRKRDWMSPKQAVMSSVFAIAVSCLGFFGYEEVNAALTETDLIATHTPAQHTQRRVDTQVTPAQKLNPAVSQKSKMTAEEAFADLSSKLEELYLANESIVELGEFAWPVNFGIVDPEHISYRQQHQGISIEAELGDPVVAINDGVVIYSNNEIRGYGNMIVIQHDQDLLSVYANNQFNYVNEGDEVKRGQLIGDIGQLFNEDTAGLYFEIRRDGVPTDPFSYLRNHAPNGAGLISAR